MGGSKAENDREKAYESLHAALEKAGVRFLHIMVPSDIHASRVLYSVYTWSTFMYVYLSAMVLTSMEFALEEMGSQWEFSLPLDVSNKKVIYLSTELLILLRMFQQSCPNGIICRRDADLHSAASGLHMIPDIVDAITDSSCCHRAVGQWILRCPYLCSPLVEIVSVLCSHLHQVMCRFSREILISCQHTCLCATVRLSFWILSIIRNAETSTYTNKSNFVVWWIGLDFHKEDWDLDLRYRPDGIHTDKVNSRSIFAVCKIAIFASQISTQTARHGSLIPTMFLILIQLTVLEHARMSQAYRTASNHCCQTCAAECILCQICWYSCAVLIKHWLSLSCSMCFHAVLENGGHEGATSAILSRGNQLLQFTTFAKPSSNDFTSHL